MENGKVLSLNIRWNTPEIECNDPMYSLYVSYTAEGTAAFRVSDPEQLLKKANVNSSPTAETIERIVSSMFCKMVSMHSLRVIILGCISVYSLNEHIEMIRPLLVQKLKEDLEQCGVLLDDMTLSFRVPKLPPQFASKPSAPTSSPVDLPTLTCPACGASVHASKFCTYCGYKLN